MEKIIDLNLKNIEQFMFFPSKLKNITLGLQKINNLPRN